MLRRSRRLSVERDTATSTPKRMTTVLEAVAENAGEKAENEEEGTGGEDGQAEEEISPVTTNIVANKAKSPPVQTIASPSVRKRFGAMLGSFIDKIPLTRHSFSMNSDNDSDVAVTGSSPAKKNQQNSSDLNQTLDKNFKLTTTTEGGGENNTKKRVSDVHEEDESEEESSSSLVDNNKRSPKKSHLERFMERAPKARHSMDDQVASSPTKNKSPLNKSLDKNYKNTSNSSLSLDEDEEEDEIVEVQEKSSPVAKKNHLSVFTQKTVTTRHSIVTTTTIDQSKKAATTNLNKSLNKDFKATATEKGKVVAVLDEEEPMEIDLVASSNSEEEEEEDEASDEEECVEVEEVSNKNKSLNKSVVSQTEAKEVVSSSPRKTPVSVSAAVASPRKSLNAFRAESNADKEEGDQAVSPTKEDMIRQILERTIQEQIEKQFEDDPEEDSSDDDEEEQVEVEEEDTKVVLAAKSPKKELVVVAKSPAKEEVTSPVKKVTSPVKKVVTPVKEVITPVKKSPKKAAQEVVPKDEDEDDDSMDGGDEEEEDDDDAEEDDEDDSGSDDGSVCKFEMEDDVVEEEVNGEDNDADSSSDAEENAPEEDVVINTKKLKTNEPATKVSDILNKCQSFLVDKGAEKKEARTVDEEKRQRKKEQKDAKQKKRAAEMARREELMAKQAAQKELVVKKNVAAVTLQKKRGVEEKKARKAQAKEWDTTTTVTATATTTDKVNNEKKKTAKKTSEVAEKQKLVKKEKPAENSILAKGVSSDRAVIKKLDSLFASNVEKGKKNGQENEAPKNKKKTLKILQATASASEMAATLQKPKQKRAHAQNGEEEEDNEYVPKKSPNLIPDKKYHQLAKDQKREQNRLKDEAKLKQGRPLKTIVKEPLRVLPKPVWTPAGEFEVEVLSSPEKQLEGQNKKKDKMRKRLAQTNGTDFQVEVLNEAGVGVNGKGNFREQHQNRKNIRREESHSLLKRRKFH